MKVKKYNSTNKNFEKRVLEFSSIANEKKGYYDNLLNVKLSNKGSEDMPWTRYYSHEQLSSVVPVYSIYDLMYSYGSKHLDDIALVYPNKIGEYKYTYKKLFRMINKCCISLLKSGVNDEDIVTVALPSTVEAIVLIYSLAKLGIVINMVHPLASINEINDNLKLTKSRYLFVHHGLLNDSRSNIDKIMQAIGDSFVKKVIVVNPSEQMPWLFNKIYTNKVEASTVLEYEDDELFEMWKNFIARSKKGKSKIVEKYLSTHIINASKCGVMLSTGGTTGTPKLVQLSHNNVNACAYSLVVDNTKMVSGKDTTLLSLPLFHGFGLINCMHMSLCSGVKVVIIASFDAKEYAKFIKKYNATVLIGVPAMFTSLLKYGKKLNLSKIKYMVYGGDKMSQKTRAELNTYLKEHKAKTMVLPGYGLSEAGGALVKSKEEDEYVVVKNDKNIEGVNIGIPLPHTKIMIYNPRTSKEVTGYLKEGIICACGPSVGLGYYKNLEETKNTYFTYNKEIWLNTGDIGYMDKHGILFFTQRAKDIIITNGYNIYPSQVEILTNEYPVIKNSALIGVPHEYKGEVPVFLIELDLNNTYIDYKALKEELFKTCSKNLPEYAQPTKIIFMDSFPQTKMKKLDKVALRKMCISGKIK